MQCRGADGRYEASFCAGGVGPGGTGMLMRVNLPREVNSATLSYRVKFDDNYDWTAGGKLPGLCDSGAHGHPHPCRVES